MSAPQTEVLVFVDGQEIARHILGSGAHTFGSSDGCSIRIEAELVSPRHAQLTVGHDGALLLEDLGSADGTFLDGRRIAAPTPAAPNQIIQIGAGQILLLQGAADACGDSTVGADGAGAPSEFSQIARYEIGAEIAKGGMGAVLAARQPSIRREVALKVMLRKASAHDRARFIREAQITGQLEHPNIVPVHDLALNEDGQPYYSMKLVKGRTLKEILKLLAQGDAAAIAKYPFAALLTIFQKVCDAAAFAHARGVIHRDLKPSNIMVGEYGEVLVMDWGLAKDIRNGGLRGAGGISETAPPIPPDAAPTLDDRREAFATVDGAVMGTPHYMSPEQARGEVATLEQRSDIFSLGVILYELVTLSRPFPGKTTREILEKIKDGDFVLPNARLRGMDAPHPRHLPAEVIPESLEAVISKALATHRRDRYQWVTDLQADLTACQAGFATRAENAGAWQQFTLLMKRQKSLSAAIAASALLIAGIIAALTAETVVERHRAAAERAKAEAVTAEIHPRAREAGRVDTAVAEHSPAAHPLDIPLREASVANSAVPGKRTIKDDRWVKGIAELALALDQTDEEVRQALQKLEQIAPECAAALRTELARTASAREDQAARARDADPTAPRIASPRETAAAGEPIEVKFTAIDRRKVDLAKLHGKVVLLDFWATWRRSCMDEIPQLVEIYHKYHDEGFEIVGISFDHDKAAVRRVTKQKEMTWPEYFDGKGWQNNYGVEYGIRNIPAMWLIDKQGRIATTDASQDLAEQVEKLLAANGESLRANDRGSGSPHGRGSDQYPASWTDIEEHDRMWPAYAFARHGMLEEARQAVEQKSDTQAHYNQGVVYYNYWKDRSPHAKTGITKEDIVKYMMDSIIKTPDMTPP